MIPETNDPLLIGCAVAAAALVYGALWLAGYAIGEWRDWRWRKRIARERKGPMIRWEAAMDPRTRHLADLKIPAPWDEAEPPRDDLGRFDCAGRYRFPKHRP